MRKSIAEQLRDTGLADDRSVALAKANEELASETPKPQTEVGKYDLLSLNSASDTAEFKKMAFDLLRQNPDHIQKIVKSAHDLFPVDSNKPENKRLHRFVLQVREALRALHNNELESYLKLAFRRSKPIVTLREYRDKMQRR